MKQSTRDPTSTLAVVLCLFIIYVHVETQLSDGDYIIRVTSVCPTHPNGSAQVQVLTDVPDTFPYVICFNNSVYNMARISMGRWTKDVTFDAEDYPKDCVFNRNENSQTYIIYVFVPITSVLILGREPPHVITCTYDKRTEQYTQPAEIGENTNPVVEVLENMGPLSRSVVELDILDVSGQKITGRIRIGKMIQLQAKLIGDYHDEVSFQTVSCKALGEDSSYFIILGGCGDGKVLPRGSGFLTNGTVAVSPFFRAFRLPDISLLSFSCTFIICKTNCDGISRYLGSSIDCTIQNCRYGPPFVTKTRGIKLYQEMSGSLTLTTTTILTLVMPGSGNGSRAMEANPLMVTASSTISRVC